MYVNRGRYGKAEPLLRRVWEVEVKAKPDDWSMLNNQSRFGEVLVGLKKYSEAEPLLEAAFAGLKEREAKLPATDRAVILQAAAARLALLYEATDRPDEAKKWRNEAAKYPEPAPPPREKK